jgi:hypothetical protein
VEFVTWATKTLFTVQMGSEESKEELIKTIGISMKETKRFIKTSASNIQCLYLLYFGKVKDMRQIFNISDDIDDDNIVCKYGRSKDLNQRLNKYTSDYKKNKNKHNYINLIN